MKKIVASSAASLAVVFSLAAVGAGVEDFPGSQHDSCRNFDIATGNAPTLRVVNGHGVFEVTKKRKDIRVELDGRRLAAESIRQDGSILSVLDEQGSAMLMIGIFRGGVGRDGQLVYTPDLDPTSAGARLGLDAEPIEKEIAVHLALEPGQALVVSDVCPGMPAELAGLQENDVILEIDGRTASTRELLNRTVASKGGDEPIRLIVLQRGGREDVAVRGLDPRQWPDPDSLEDYLRLALNGGRR